jgi:hypothetical protein
VLLSGNYTFVTITDVCNVDFVVALMLLLLLFC